MLRVAGCRPGNGSPLESGGFCAITGVLLAGAGGGWQQQEE